MSDAKVRETVKAMYPKSKRWSKKVDHMSDSQVFAIYKRTLQSKGK